ncbi:DUF5606 family protein [Plebeiibacterium sediminum]|uniref:DUF5606 domain-containing protein n=1 Tax=Plebeiibacterium sediminum TaxID=2992112 RepID=A0AAE3M6U9_9BACT|nr:DUF5606 domain-containing protein [Plebeiobacterium sediminum]MCW3788091.1 DUF5606 domain-containing protein [Plebeiobacterium sediminum]
MSEMLKGILAVSGQGGLFKIVSQAKNSIIVESLVDGKRMPAYATSRISALEDISIFTEDGDVKLYDVFKNISEKEDGGQAISHKASANELKKYFAEILPDYDQDRVYVSDMKKVIQWYNLLQEKEVLNFSEEEAAEEEVKTEE